MLFKERFNASFCVLDRVLAETCGEKTQKIFLGSAPPSLVLADTLSDTTIKPPRFDLKVRQSVAYSIFS